MASPFNFGRVASKMRIVEKNFLTKGIELARDEMVKNITSQTSAESGKAYPPLTYLLNWKIPKPPPRLILTGELFDQIKTNRIQIIGRLGKLTIDPIDSRGKGYASYHEEGENQYKSKDEFQAEFVTQSTELSDKQEQLLLNETTKAFN